MDDFVSSFQPFESRRGVDTVIRVKFRYDADLGGYIFNLDTTGLGPGTYTLWFTVAGDPVRHSVTFVIR